MHRRAPAALVLLLALGACGPNSRQAALQTSLRALNTARDGFVAWDSREQERIVDRATSLEDGRAQLATHRGRRDRVVQGFVAAYAALALAALEPTLANLAAAAAEAKKVYDAVRVIGGP